MTPKARILHRRDEGFSLLEMLVAVAIIAIALVPLAGLEVRAQRTQAGLAARQSLAEAQLGALEVLRDVNVMEAPDGSAELGAGYAMEWRSTPLTAATPTLQPSGAPGPFDVALYRIDVTVRGGTTQSSGSFSFEQTGWRKKDNAGGRDNSAVSPPQQ